MLAAAVERSTVANAIHAENHNVIMTSGDWDRRSYLIMLPSGEISIVL
jgi:hypothetical protein